MVIERAERFGLSQLHQLRGRVGRGGEASYCMLLYDEGLGWPPASGCSSSATRKTGFAIADADFRLRGAGEALGTRQSGAPVFRLGLKEAEAQDRLIAIAHRDAALLIEKDPAWRTANEDGRPGCCWISSRVRKRYEPSTQVERMLAKFTHYCLSGSVRRAVVRGGVWPR
jgi:RecG-like helicase